MIQKLSAFWQRLWALLAALPERKAFRVALAIWLIFGAVVATIVAVQPERRTATKEYQVASEKWWKSETIFRKKNGYLYLPQWAMYYTPYDLLPDRVGEPLWRLTMLALLGFAVWKAAGKACPEKKARLFLVATVLLLPSALSSARNGQVNMPLGALYLLSAIAISEKKWWWSAILLALSLALKPISVVPILLCGALFAPLRLPLVVSIIGMLASVFIHPNPGYVSDQYAVFWSNLINNAGKPKVGTWCDFAEMLRTFKIHLPDIITLGIRASAALVALAMAWRASKITDAFRSAYTILFIAVVYLMLFNPRTETNSYVMLGTFVGLWGAYEGVVCRKLNAAAWLAAIAVVLGSECYGNPIFPWTNLWLKALVTLLLGTWLAVALIRTPRGEPVLLKPASPA